MDEIKLSNDYKVYCFDYYDTIVHRSVEPEYVKKIWCKELKDAFAISLNVESIYNLRNEKEAFLCSKNQKNGFDLEFQYERLLEEMYEALVLRENTAWDDFKVVAADIELNIEKRVQKIYKDVTEEIKRLKKQGKKIYCISDFYTSSFFLRELLKYHGIDTLFDGVFVSSDNLITKRSGRLYDYVLDELSVDPQDVLMMGDNQYSDYSVPINKGMNAIHLDREEEKKKYQNFLSVHNNKAYLSNVLNDIYKKSDRNRYEELSFSLYYFIDKLYAKLKCNGIKNVFFLSREGEFLKKIFDFYQSNRCADSNYIIHSHYLMVSRKATFIASLKPLREENFEMIFRQYVNISLYDFFSSLGFAMEIQEELGKRLGEDIYRKQVDLPRTELYKNMMDDEYFQQEYEKLRVEQRQNFAEYLKTFGVDFEKDGMCLVDVGWKGTIQDNILLFFEEKIKIMGLYLGLVAPGKVHPNNIKEGLLFTNLPYPQKNFYIYDENKSVYEVMLGASHGSADRYIKTSNGIEVATAGRPEERELFVKLIEPMQQGIFSKIKEIDNALLNHCFDKVDLEKIVAKIHAKLVFLPRKAQIDLFYHIYHYENFGVFEFTKFKTKDKISLAERVKNLKRMFMQRRAFLQSSFWGVVALKDAGLGFLIKPYGWYMYNKCYRKENEQ